MKSHRILIVAASSMIVALTGANAQYITNFGPTGYTLPAPNNAPFFGAFSLSGQNNWDTNDNAQPDFVGIVNNGYSQNSHDYWAELGGLTNSVPETTTTELWNNVTFVDTHFNPGANAQFSARMAISSSDLVQPARDSFSWKFGTAGSNGTPGTLITSIDFVPETLPDTTQVMRIYYTDNAGQHSSIANNALGYDAQYDIVATLTGLQSGQTPHLTVSFDPVGPITGYTVINADVSLANPTATIATVGAVWNLSDTTFDNINNNYPNYGLNTLIFDNYAVVVPEPSVFALLGFALLGVVYLRSRKKTATV